MCVKVLTHRGRRVLKLKAPARCFAPSQGVCAHSASWLRGQRSSRVSRSPVCLQLQHDDDYKQVLSTFSKNLHTMQQVLGSDLGSERGVAACWFACVVRVCSSVRNAAMRMTRNQSFSAALLRVRGRRVWWFASSSRCSHSH